MASVSRHNGESPNPYEIAFLASIASWSSEFRFRTKLRIIGLYESYFCPIFFHFVRDLENLHVDSIGCFSLDSFPFSWQLCRTRTPLCLDRGRRVASGCSCYVYPNRLRGTTVVLPPIGSMCTFSGSRTKWEKFGQKYRSHCPGNRKFRPKMGYRCDRGSAPPFSPNAW